MCVFVPLHAGVLSILTYLPVLIVFRDATLRIAFLYWSVLIVKYKYKYKYPVFHMHEQYSMIGLI